MILRMFNKNKMHIRNIARINESNDTCFHQIEQLKSLLSNETTNLRNKTKIIKQIIILYKEMATSLGSREHVTVSNRKRNRLLRFIYQEIQVYESELFIINTHIANMLEINPVCYIEITNFTEEKVLLLKDYIKKMRISAEAKKIGSYSYLRVLERDLKEIIDICLHLKLNVSAIPFDQVDNLKDFFGYAY